MSELSFNIVDFHTHIMPSFDDGAKDVDMAIQMLIEAKKQNIKTLVSSSHFYPSENNPDNFIKTRDQAFSLLKNEMKKHNDLNDVVIKKAAEIAYFPGIGDSEEISKLVLENTNYILLEMPFYFWDDQVINDVINIRLNLGLNIILVHVDRYIKLGFKKYFNKLSSIDGVLFQVNGESIISRCKFSRFLKKLYMNGYIHLLGSDMHNISTRKENLKDAVDILSMLDPSMLKRIETIQKFIVK